MFRVKDRLSTFQQKLLLSLTEAYFEHDESLSYFHWNCLPTHVFLLKRQSAVYGHYMFLSKLIANDVLMMRHKNVLLKTASRCGHLVFLKRLLVSEDKKNRIRWDNRSIVLAASSGHVDCIKELVKFIDPSKVFSTALRLATRRGNIDCVYELLRIQQRCVPVDFHLNATFIQAIEVAANYGHLVCLRLLVARCRKYFPMTSHSLALRIASDNNYVTCAKELIPVSIRSNESATTDCVVQWAAANGHDDHLRDILKMCKGVNPKANNGLALRCAAEYGHVNCLKQLLKVYLPIDSTSLNWLHLALVKAAANDHPECVCELLACSDKVDPNYMYCQALCFAAREGSLECVKTLAPYTLRLSNDKRTSVIKRALRLSRKTTQYKDVENVLSRLNKNE